MGNGEDLIEIMKKENQQTIDRLKDWDEGIDSKHDHRPIVDGIQRILNLFEVSTARMLKVVDELKNTQDKIENNDHQKTIIQEARPAATKLKQKTSVSLFGGMIKFDGFELRDLGRIAVVCWLIWITLKMSGVDVPTFTK